MKALGFVAIIVGIILLVISFVYFSTPAHFLPAFFPGHDIALKTIHYKHGIGAFVLALLCFAFAWFNTKKKSPKE